MFLNTSIVILCKSFDQSLFEKKLLHTSPKSTSQDFHTVSLVLSLLIIWKVCVHMSRYLIVFILLPLFYFRQITSGYLSKLSTKTREDITLYPLLTEIILRKSRLVVDFLSVWSPKNCIETHFPDTFRLSHAQVICSAFRLNWKYLKPYIKLKLIKLAFLINQQVFLKNCTVNFLGFLNANVRIKDSKQCLFFTKENLICSSYLVVKALKYVSGFSPYSIAIKSYRTNWK